MQQRPMALLASATIPGVVVLAAAGAARAEIGEHTIKFAIQNSKGHPSVEGMDKFKELVEEKSDGNLTVRLYPGVALQTLSTLQGGTVEMTDRNAGLVAGVVARQGRARGRQIQAGG